MPDKLLFIISGVGILASVIFYGYSYITFVIKVKKLLDAGALPFGEPRMKVEFDFIFGKYDQKVENAFPMRLRLIISFVSLAIFFFLFMSVTYMTFIQDAAAIG